MNADRRLPAEFEHRRPEPGPPEAGPAELGPPELGPPVLGPAEACADAPSGLELYLEGELHDPLLRSEARRHLDRCPVCREHARRHDALTARILAGAAGDAPTRGAGRAAIDRAAIDRILALVAAAEAPEDRGRWAVPPSRPASTPRLDGSPREVPSPRPHRSRVALRAAAALALAGIWIALALTIRRGGGERPDTRQLSTARLAGERPAAGLDARLDARDPAGAAAALRGMVRERGTEDPRPDLDGSAALLRWALSRRPDAPVAERDSLRLWGIRSALPAAEAAGTAAGTAAGPPVEWIVDALPSRWGRAHADARFFLVPEDGAHSEGSSALEFLPVAWFAPPSDAAAARALPRAARVSRPLYRVYVIAYPRSPPPNLPAAVEGGGRDVPVLRVGVPPALDPWAPPMILR